MYFYSIFVGEDSHLKDSNRSKSKTLYIEIKTYILVMVLFKLYLRRTFFVFSNTMFWFVSPNPISRHLYLLLASILCKAERCKSRTELKLEMRDVLTPIITSKVAAESEQTDRHICSSDAAKDYVPSAAHFNKLSNFQLSFF